jgi:hypothetical protein
MGVPVGVKWSGVTTAEVRKRSAICGSASDAIVYETRVNLANLFNKFAEEAAGKPPIELPPMEGPPSEQPLPTADTEEDVPA